MSSILALLSNLVLRKISLRVSKVPQRDHWCFELILDRSVYLVKYVQKISPRLLTMYSASVPGERGAVLKNLDS